MTAQHTATDMTVRHVGAITIVDLLDRRLIDTARIESLGARITDLINNANAVKLIINFDKVEYLSSTMLNVLIALETAVKRKKGKLALAHLDPELQKVFTLMKLNKVMTICKTVDDAMSEMKE